MRGGQEPLDPLAFESLCDEVAAAVARCSDEQVLDLADSLHASLRRRRSANLDRRIEGERRSWTA